MLKEKLCQRKSVESVLFMNASFSIEKNTTNTIAEVQTYPHQINQDHSV